MPGPSLFCEHKKLRSVCFLCGAARAGAATPARGPAAHDVDASWRVLRLECHRRFRRMLEAARGQPWEEAHYWAAYDRPERNAKRSDEEDPSTFRGAFYRSMVKLFDVTIETRRIQGYNGLADWDEMRDYLFRRHPPEAFAGLLKDGKLHVHGGNGAWPRQQIASELVRSPRLREAVDAVAFGADGAGPLPEAIDEAEAVRRLEAVDALARGAGAEVGSLSFASKVLHAFAPARWPAYTHRATPEVGERLGLTLPPVAAPRDYPAFAEALRAYAKAKGHPDLVMADIQLSAAYDELTSEGDDEELPPLDD